jgi:GNAT superfamily N-acetyltransferase
MSKSSTTKVTDQHPSHNLPRLDVPFLEAFRVTYGPPGLYGRYFLQFDKIARELGLTLSFCRFEDLLEPYLQNAENWGFFNPMFDPRVSDIPDGRAMCLVGRDKHGKIVATVSGKFFEAPDRTFREIVETGEFFAIRPKDNALNLSARLQAPIGDEMRGRLAYCGQMWVHPDHRGLRIASLFVRTMNALMVTLWNADYALGFLRPNVIGTRLHEDYGFAHHQPSFTIYHGEKIAIEAYLVWLGEAETAVELARFLDTLPAKVDTGVIARNRQNTR